jgi:ATP-dependent protease Clp ATPase subunit
MIFRLRLACSFCGRKAADVNKLVAGRSAYICDQCAEESVRIMEASGDPRPGAERPRWLGRIVDTFRHVLHQRRALSHTSAAQGGRIPQLQ